MPHLVVEYSRIIEEQLTPADMLRLAHDTAVQSGLFGEKDIKVRLMPFDHAWVGGIPETFLHVTIYLLSGRDAETKKRLTGSIAQALQERLPEIQSISVDARDMERESYSKILKG